MSSVVNTNNINTNEIQYTTLSCQIPENYFGPDIICAYGNQVIVAIDASGRFRGGPRGPKYSLSWQILQLRQCLAIWLQPSAVQQIAQQQSAVFGAGSHIADGIEFMRQSVLGFGEAGLVECVPQQNCFGLQSPNRRGSHPAHTDTNLIYLPMRHMHI